MTSLSEPSTLLVNKTETREVWIGTTKMHIPKRLGGTKNNTQQAVSFYTTSNKLEGTSKDITAQALTTALAENLQP